MKLINPSIFRSVTVTALLAASSFSSPAVTLSDLTATPNASIVVGNLRFFNFSNILQTGDLNVPLDRILVEPILGGPGAAQSDFGIRFTSEDWSLSAPSLTYDLSLDFHVETVTGAARITDNTLEFDGTVTGNAFAVIGESVLDADSGQSLANKLVLLDANLRVLEDHQVFPGGPYTHLEISKDFFMASGNGTVTVTHFDQTFSQVPEGGPGLAVIAGALGIICWAGRKRRRTQATLGLN
jgi:hypothetical protein